MRNLTDRLKTVETGVDPHLCVVFCRHLHLLFWGAFHLSELTGQTIPVVMRISLLIKTIHPDQSNPKQCAARR